jgi:hypothetical protein
MNKIKQSRAIKAYEIVKKEYLKQQNIIKPLEDSLKQIRKHGVMNYESQAKALNKAYADALADNKTAGAKQIEQKLAILAEYGGAYISIRDLLYYEMRISHILEAKMNEVKVDCFENIPYSFVVSKAEKAEKHTYPIRWLVILGSTISTFLLTIILLIFLDKFKNIHI